MLRHHKERNMSNYPKVLLTEEGMRDGLQIERADIPVDAKIQLARYVVGDRVLKKSRLAPLSVRAGCRRWPASKSWSSDFIPSRA